MISVNFILEIGTCQDFTGGGCLWIGNSFMFIVLASSAKESMHNPHVIMDELTNWDHALIIIVQVFLDDLNESCN